MNYGNLSNMILTTKTRHSDQRRQGNSVRQNGSSFTTVGANGVNTAKGYTRGPLSSSMNFNM